MIYAMSEEEPDHESFEDRLRAFAKDLGESVERVTENFDLDQIADQIATGGERVRELADVAGQWLTEQFGDDHARTAARAAQAGRRRLAGPHPLDVPSEEQALALSALASGRWMVAPGTNELVSDGDEPTPSAPVGLVGELRARDWIAASGEVTGLGHDALKRWSESTGS
jgi:hypothetical protein